MLDDGNQFLNLVQSSDRFKARFDATVAHMTNEARTLFGCDLTVADILAVPSARLATLTDDGLSPNWVEEVKKTPTVQNALKTRELRAALESNDEASHAALAKLPRDQRIARARELGMTETKPAGTKPAESNAVLLRRLLTLPPQQRIAKARAWGII